MAEVKGSGGCSSVDEIWWLLVEFRGCSSPKKGKKQRGGLVGVWALVGFQFIGTKSSSPELGEDREIGVLGWRRGWFGGGSGWRRRENGVLGEPGGFLVIVMVWCGGEERNNGVLGSFGGWFGGLSSRARGLVKIGSFTEKTRRTKVVLGCQNFAEFRSGASESI
ncbi:hypothetical protein KY290_001550 [Solanum tuberosum]|uniref:Uncharacterized protein n=1 Tax=Solanum tuberosum TaxID=4113 RepID=A0ABQ7WPS5_SOLTU|nr:hypothetical protein KY290_001550 [Solanum tuberosum]